MPSEDEIAKELLQEADKRLDLLADTIFSKSQENIVQNGTTDTGFLLRSGYVKRAFCLKEIGYTSPYAGAIEFGTDPHFPPVEPLVKWAQRKLGLSDKEAKKAAWGIARKIEKEGTSPQPFFRPAIESAKSSFKGSD